MGVGFFYQDQSLSASLFAVGYTALLVVKFDELAQALRLRQSLHTAVETAADAGPRREAICAIGGIDGPIGGPPSIETSPSIG